MSNIFDKLTKENAFSGVMEIEPSNDQDSLTITSTTMGEVTPKATRIVVQELLKYGLLEADRKPNLFQTAVQQQKSINKILEPLDLCLKVDDIRGLSFLVISEHFVSAEGEDDEWSHPLIRRHRFTLEQSLVVAILRQLYIAHEKEAGIGTGTVIAIDDLIPQIQVYFGESGSDLKDQKRVRVLLDNLKGHGIVSDIDDKDQVVIRPIITHLANPETLQGLLSQYKKVNEKNDSTLDDRRDLNENR